MSLDMTTLAGQVRFWLKDYVNPELYGDDEIAALLTQSTTRAQKANDPLLGIPILAAALGLELEAVAASRDAIVERIAIIMTDERNLPIALREVAQGLRDLGVRMGLIPLEDILSVTATVTVFNRLNPLSLNPTDKWSDW